MAKDFNDRYFYIPMSCVTEIVNKAKTEQRNFFKKLETFMRKYDLTFYLQHPNTGCILELGFKNKGLMTDDWVFKRDDVNSEDKSICVVKPNKKSKNGKLIQKELDKLNEEAISDYIPARCVLFVVP